MFYVTIHSYAVTASFRIPETHTFQQTLPLPPITTLIGILGAAAGWSFEKAIGFCKEKMVQFGVVGTHNGKTKDLWKYHKIKSGETISAVLLREFLTDLEMTIYVAVEDKSIAEEIRRCFLHPYYALTAGNSDDLLKIRKVLPVKFGEVVLARDFKETVIGGNHVANYESNIDIRSVPLMKDLYTPQVHLLPTEFEFSGLERRVKERQPFTFVDTLIKLKTPVRALNAGNWVVALL
ncbi:MAG: CRISPR-associated protein Cas5 [Bacillota bacterium]|jgi:CRISPR-associated protein Cas5t